MEEHRFSAQHGQENTQIQLQRLSSLLGEHRPKSLVVYSAWGPVSVFPKQEYSENDIRSFRDAEMGEAQDEIMHIQQPADLPFAWALFLPNKIAQTIAALGPENRSVHWNLAALSTLREGIQAKNASSDLHVTLFPGGMEVWIIKRGKLLLANRFFCERAEDFVYHIMNCGQQSDWSPREDQLFIRGTDEWRSKIVDTLPAYVRHVHVESAKDAVAERMQLLNT